MKFLGYAERGRSMASQVLTKVAALPGLAVRVGFRVPSRLRLRAELGLPDDLALPALASALTVRGPMRKGDAERTPSGPVRPLGGPSADDGSRASQARLPAPAGR